MKNVNVHLSNKLRSNVDLNILNYGYLHLPLGRKFEPEPFKHYLFYFISRGKARFILNGNTFTLRENELFLIPPESSVSFMTETENTAIHWIAFWGTAPKTYLDLSDLTEKTPVFVCADNNTLRNYFERLVDECKTETYGDSVKALGYLYLIFAALLMPQNRKLTNRQEKKLAYAREAVTFIHSNYMHNISVKEISEHVSLERTYFSSLFKEAIGISPIDYLIKYRIDQAILLMVDPTLTLTEIARMVGFNDPISFSIRFKAVTSQSPSAYRNHALPAPHYIKSVFEDKPKT